MKSATLDPKLDERLTAAERRFAEVNDALASPDVLSNSDKLRELGQERSHLDPVVTTGGRLRAALEEHGGALELLESDEADMRALASAEIARLEKTIDALSAEVRELLVPQDPLGDRAAVIEIRAGTGGDEAGLFASDLMEMYRRMAERQGWTIELMSLSHGIPGSIKEAIFTVRGRGVYGRLRWESGVHRVQRVPATEGQGRIHTSAATVAVLPEAEEVDLHIEPGDLRIDVYRSSGPGGQSVNTTDSAVRITHLPSGLVVTCQDEKSQHKNKAKALKVLRSRLLDQMIAEREAVRARERKTQVGTGDRSAKIRTYNFPQNRVTDHRIGLTLHKLTEVLNGDLGELMNALRLADEDSRKIAHAGPAQGIQRLAARLVELGERPELVHAFTDIFLWDFDFSTQTRPGDEFRLVFEKYFDKDGFVRYGRVLAAEYRTAQRTHTAVYYEGADGYGDYFTPDGRSVKRSFLRAPLKFQRISSRFTNLRMHPVLKIGRPHWGVDYAAPTGTPVWKVAFLVVSSVVSWEACPMHLRRLLLRPRRRLPSAWVATSSPRPRPRMSGRRIPPSRSLPASREW